MCKIFDVNLTFKNFRPPPVPSKCNEIPCNSDDRFPAKEKDYDIVKKLKQSSVAILLKFDPCCEHCKE